MFAVQGASSVSNEGMLRCAQLLFIAFSSCLVNTVDFSWFCKADFEHGALDITDVVSVHGLVLVIRYSQDGKNNCSLLQYTY